MMLRAPAGLEPLDLLVAERVGGLEVDVVPSGLRIWQLHRLVGREVGQAEHADAVVLADLVVGGRVGERQRQERPAS